MNIFRGVIREINLGSSGRGARIDCPPGAIPTPGRYVTAWPTEIAHQALAETLYPASFFQGGFQAAPPVPRDWEPGMELVLRGPLGHGFQLPARSLRLLLVSVGDTAERLLALLPSALENGSSVTICTDGPFMALPPEVEILPLESLPDLLSWADFLAMDVPRYLVPSLPGWLGQRQDIPGQVLVHSLMPCGGLAGCGSCAVQGKRHPRLVCEDGPVFSLADLEW